MTDKVEAVQKVTETLSKQNPAEEMDRHSPNKEHFDNLMSTTTNPLNPSFERIDNKAHVEEISIEKTQSWVTKM